MLAGRDGNSITVRGTFDQSASYRRLDVVARNGRSFALKGSPGPCPGPGSPAKASAALPARGESAAFPAREAIQD
jgi:hypothetical protein